MRHGGTRWTSPDHSVCLLQLLPLDAYGLGMHGLPTGVQTTTTPTLTLTPTTLRSLATTVDFLSGAMDDEQPTYHNEAGFVPPIVNCSSSTYINMVDSKAWQGGSVTTMPAGASASNPGGVGAIVSVASSTAASLAPSHPLPAVSPCPSSSSPTPSVTPARRSVGGRRPNKAKGISPQEEERRQVRRDRNKAAAARCRKRRMDHTNSLIIETEGLEKKKQGLQQEIQELKMQMDELQYILESHVCRRPSRPEPCSSPPDIKPTVPTLFEVKQEPRLDEPLPAKRPHLSMPAPPPAQSKPPRPTSLPVSSHTILRSSAAEIAGISITTPSTGIPLNFDSLMDGGTGLTPVSGPLVPSCSSQQRNQNSVDLSSPDSNIGNKLVSL
ncbi:transcription factor kayak [Frankliniella occidentalis]|nr:transcription factor kayak [Frankliniella occidentalis]